MPIMRVGRNEQGMVTVDSVDTGERLLSPSERARLQLMEDVKEREAAEAEPSAKASEKLRQPARQQNIDGGGDRTDEQTPRSEGVSTDRIEQAKKNAADFERRKAETLAKLQAEEEEKKKLEPKPAPSKKDRPRTDEDDIAAMVEAGLGSDVEDRDPNDDTTVLDAPQPQPQPEPPADPEPTTDEDEDDIRAQLEEGLNEGTHPDDEGGDPDEDDGGPDPGTVDEHADPDGYPCPHCEFVPQSKAGLTNHINAKHAE